MRLQPDTVATKEWIYPLNNPKRDYQYNIVRKALLANTLVALPTGLGKTFIAGCVMLNYYRWFPEGAIVFLAPTKPLVNQQIYASHQTCGIPGDQAALLTGEVKDTERTDLWKRKRVFYCTPQTFVNDLRRIPELASRIVLLVIDEAHRATGAYAYSLAVRDMMVLNPHFRVLALTATPGSNTEAVQAVVDRMHISHIEIRDESALDLQRYIYKKHFQQHVVDVTPQISAIGDAIIKLMESLLPSVGQFIPGANMATMHEFRPQAASRDLAPKDRWAVANLMNLAALARALGYLNTQSVEMCYEAMCAFEVTTTDSNGKTKYGSKQLCKTSGYQKVMELLKTLRGSTTGLVMHPKMIYLRSLLLDYFNSQHNNDADGTDGEPKKESKVMVFVQFRKAVEHIVDILNQDQPVIRAHRFIGQATSKEGVKGLSQNQQNKVIDEFKAGKFNTLVCTSIGEEGLDIGEVDFIVCYDSHKAPIKMLQRVGRTGRKKEGHIAVLVAQGKEEKHFEDAKQKYNDVQNSIHKQNIELYTDVPRLIPSDIQPQPREMVMDIIPYSSEKIAGATGKTNGTGAMDKYVKKTKEPKMTAKEKKKLMADVSALLDDDSDDSILRPSQVMVAEDAKKKGKSKSKSKDRDDAAPKYKKSTKKPAQSDSSDDESPPVKKSSKKSKVQVAGGSSDNEPAPPKKSKKKKKLAPSDSSDDDEPSSKPMKKKRKPSTADAASSEVDEPRPKKVKKKPTRAASNASSDEETAEKKKSKGKKVKESKSSRKRRDRDSDDSTDDDSPAPPKKKKRSSSIADVSADSPFPYAPTHGFVTGRGRKIEIPQASSPVIDISDDDSPPPAPIPHHSPPPSPEAHPDFAPMFNLSDRDVEMSPPGPPNDSDSSSGDEMNIRPSDQSLNNPLFLLSSSPVIPLPIATKFTKTIIQRHGSRQFKPSPPPSSPPIEEPQPLPADDEEMEEDEEFPLSQKREPRCSPDWNITQLIPASSSTPLPDVSPVPRSQPKPTKQSKASQPSQKDDHKWLLSDSDDDAPIPSKNKAQSSLVKSQPGNSQVKDKGKERVTDALSLHAAASPMLHLPRPSGLSKGSTLPTRMGPPTSTPNPKSKFNRFSQVDRSIIDIDSSVELISSSVRPPLDENKAGPSRHHDDDDDEVSISSVDASFAQYLRPASATSQNSSPIRKVKGIKRGRKSVPAFDLSSEDEAEDDGDERQPLSALDISEDSPIVPRRLQKKTSKTKSKRKRPVYDRNNPFVGVEAELSGEDDDNIGSTDTEEDENEYDRDFIADGDITERSDDYDQSAIYRQGLATQAPAGLNFASKPVRAGAFGAAFARANPTRRNFQVSSSPPAEPNSEDYYEFGSFVVQDDEDIGEDDV